MGFVVTLRVSHTETELTSCKQEQQNKRTAPRVRACVRAHL
jgi:hypothetical protein